MQTAPNSGFPAKLATDPPVSEKQRRAMWAAAEGHSTLGIPKSVGKEYVGADAEPRRAAGVALRAPDGDCLFVRRGGTGDHAGEWAFPGGFAEDDESPEAAAIRELTEELGFLLDPRRIRGFDQQVNGLDYITFTADVDEKFHPTLNDENIGYMWAKPTADIFPLHPGVKTTMDSDNWQHGIVAHLDMSPSDHFVKEVNNMHMNGVEAEDAGFNESDHDRDEGGKFSSSPGGKTPYSHTTASQGMTAGEKNARATAHAHANYLKGLGHEGVKVTKRWDAHTVPGKGIGGTATYTTYHGSPKPAQDANKFALDRASVRTTDADGRLHVEITPISKANVCPYLGSEIPDFEKLGLQSDRIYQLLRDPDELRKAAPSFNNLQLLMQHVPVSADDHQPEITIGSTGTDATFEHPYLKNSLVVWAKDAIDAITSNAQKELSSAYRYRADMTPGNYQGADYDGIMRDIVGNHVALVREGRAGTDVVVGDSLEAIKNQETIKMNVKLSRKATLVQGGLMVLLTPKLAADAKLPDLAAILADVTAKNYVGRKPAIIEGITKGMKLAKDAKLDDMHTFLDSLDKDEPAGDEEPDPNQTTVDEDLEEEKKAFDAEGLKNFLKDKMSEDDMKALDAFLAGDDPPPFAAQPVKEESKAMDEKTIKGIVDAEVKKFAEVEVPKATKIATDAVIKTQRELRDAEKAVRPYVGELAGAFDSAAQIYRKALEILGVKDASDVHESALPILLKNQAVPGTKKETATIAQDAAAIDSFNKRFPGAARIGSV